MKRQWAPSRGRHFVLLTALVGLAGCGESEGGEGRRGPGGDGPVPAVEAVQARRGTLPLRERLTGTVRAAGQVAIYPEASGPIVEVLAQNGDAVERGQPLVRIRAETSRSQLAQAQAGVGVAQAEVQRARASLDEIAAQYERTRTLAEEDLVSDETLETHHAQMEAARATYEQARAQVAQAQASTAERREAVGQTIVRAPISGRVGQRNAEVGMWADGQTPLFTIGRLEEVMVEVPVTQEMLGYLREGQSIELTTESLPDTVITAEISRISPFLQEGSFSAEAEIDVTNEGGALLPGMFVTVDVLYGESERTTVVPKSTLYENPETGEQGIYEVVAPGPELELVELADTSAARPLTEPKEIRFRPIEVAAEGHQLVGLNDVRPGTWVVVVGQHLLSKAGPDSTPRGRVRPLSWDRVLDLQRLQRQDLLRQFMDRQQRLARERSDSMRAEGSR